MTDFRPAGMDLISLREASRLSGLSRSILLEAFQSGEIPRLYISGLMRVSLLDLRNLQLRVLGRKGRRK